ncbi:hypothetical protein LP420_38415 [Massilia sp. B-10]|nr:hypothetical protein LP420_38415 [Massilia sp. B-10]
MLAAALLGALLLLTRGEAGKSGRCPRPHPRHMALRRQPASRSPVALAPGQQAAVALQIATVGKSADRRIERAGDGGP